jgi:hypothetical protein
MARAAASVRRELARHRPSCDSWKSCQAGCDCWTASLRIRTHPEKMFLFVAVGALALSFALPLRLSFTKSHRFAGVTPSAQAMLVLMHTVVATVAVVTLLASQSDRQVSLVSPTSAIDLQGDRGCIRGVV